MGLFLSVYLIIMVQKIQTAVDIVGRLRCSNRQEYAALEHALRADSRITVQKALQIARRRIEAEEAELKNSYALYEFDKKLSSGLILGMDEVGRGPLAGPLTVGGVVLGYENVIVGLNDSKKLSPSKREQLNEEIQKHAHAAMVHCISTEEIDAIGMAASLRKAFSELIKECEARGLMPDVVLVDGLPLHIDSREQSVIKGDSKSASIAAASIIAKVARDKLMCEYAKQYPNYSFEKNKGYASSEHISAIHKYGLCPLHRTSFCSSFLQESLF